MVTCPISVRVLVAVPLLVVLVGTLSQAVEPTLCELLKKEQELFDKVVAEGIFQADNANMRKLRTKFAYHTHGATLPLDETQAWMDVISQLEDLIESDPEVQKLIAAFKAKSDNWERERTELAAAEKSGSPDRIKRETEESEQALTQFRAADDALRAHPLGQLWWYLLYRDQHLEQLGEHLDAFASLAALRDSWPFAPANSGSNPYHFPAIDAWNWVLDDQDLMWSAHANVYRDLCETPQPAKESPQPEKPKPEPGPQTGPHPKPVTWFPGVGISPQLYPRVFSGTTGPFTVTHEMVAWGQHAFQIDPGARPSDPDPAFARVRLNPQPVPPGLPTSLAMLVEAQATGRVERLSQAAGWAEQSDPRVLTNAQLRARSFGAVLSELSFRGMISEDQSWVPEAQRMVRLALDEGRPEVADPEAKEIETLKRLATYGALTRLDATGVVSLQKLSASAAPDQPKSQAGIQFAKVTAKSGQGQPVPGATMVFTITKQTAAGPQQTTQIARTNDQGEVDILPPDAPRPADGKQPSSVVVGPDDTVNAVVVTGKTGEQPVTLPPAKAEKTTGVVIQTQSTPQHNVSLAMVADQPKTPSDTAQSDPALIAQRKADAEKQRAADAEKMATIEQALLQALLKIVGQSDAKVAPAAGRSSPPPPTHRVAMASANRDEQGGWTPQTYAQQSGAPQSAAGDKTQKARPRQPFVAWTYPVPELQTPDGLPIPVTKEQVQQAAAEIAQRPGVILAEAAAPRNAEAATPNDPYFSSQGSWGQRHMDQWALHRVGFTPLGGSRPSAWPNDLDVTRWLYAPVTVAVIGSGVDYTHPDLVSRMWVNRRERLNGADDDGNGHSDDVFGWNFRDNNRDVMDYGGHDTHIAGLIAAEWNNGSGIAGINPMARIMALKVADLFGNSDSAAISQAIYYAVDHGAKVINISYSGGQLSDAEQMALDYAAERQVLVVAAAGNQATDNTQHGIAGAAGVLTVAATAVEGDRAGFSNWGQAVEITAPGLDVLSLRARDSDFLLYVGENANYQGGSAVVGKEHDLYRAGGTSFAAPIVAGTASLIWSLQPQLTLEQVRRKLLMSAEDIDVPGWDQNTGAGLLDARKALAADPDSYLIARITRVAPGPAEGTTPTVEVEGLVTGHELTGFWLQIGFGENPGKDDWQLVRYAKEGAAGSIERIPMTRFTKPGVWTIRLLTQDKQNLVRQSRARLNLE